MSLTPEELRALFTTNLGKSLELVEEGLDSLRIPENDTQKVVVLSLWTRIRELAHAVDHLQSSPFLVGVAPLTRSMLEAFLDLAMLVKNPEYYKNLYVEYLGSQKARAEFCANDSSLESNRSVNELKTEIDSLKKEEIKKLKIKEKCVELEIDDFYMYYRLLCSESHNDLESLRRQHIKRSADGQRMRIGSHFDLTTGCRGKATHIVLGGYPAYRGADRLITRR